MSSANVSDSDTSGVDSLVVSVAASLNDQLGDITRAMRDELATSIKELDGDQRLFELLGGSIEGNVDTILHVLRHNIPVEKVEPPSAAVEYARRLAQRGVPLNALVRAYRLGQHHMLRWGFAEINRQDEDGRLRFQAAQRLVTVTFAYIDSISQEVVTVYESEREQWLQNRNTVRLTRIRELIEGTDLDIGTAEAALGYSLRQHHLGAILWLPEDAIRQDDALAGLERFVHALGRELGCSANPLFAACDRSSGWAWFPLGNRDHVPDDEGIERSITAVPDAPMLALGTAIPGIRGFRSTHRQALSAQRVALVAGTAAARVTSFGVPGVRAAARLCIDLEDTRTLVREALGPLASNDPQRARLRETLLTFLSTACNYTATAELLRMHKNTVKYRVARAQEERGAPIGDDRLDIELALIACRYLGRAVLQSSSDARNGPAEAPVSPSQPSTETR